MAVLHLRSIGMAALLILLLAGCSLPFQKAEKEEAPPQEVDLPAPVPAGDPFLVLLPERDLQLRVSVQDHGVDEPIELDEEWLREEGQRAIIATYAGSPYVRWEWNDEGLWRLDPKGGGAMLRYLPPVLVDGSVWRQQSGEAIVWFHLGRRAEPCQVSGVPGGSVECWELTVLNRGEILLFTFARGVGPIAAEAKNHARPADSFTKQLVEVRPSRLTPEQRGAFLAKLPSTGKPAAPLQPATLEEFQAAQADIPDGLARQGVAQVVGLIRAGKAIDLAKQADADGVHIHRYAPKGAGDWNGVSGEPLKQVLQALFAGADVKVEGYHVTQLAGPGLQLQIALSGVHAVTIPSSYDESLEVTGLINLKFVSVRDGSWTLQMLGVDKGYLREVLDGGKSYKTFES